MFLKSRYADFFLRVAVGLLVGCLFGWLISDVTYAMTPDKQDAERPAQTIQLVIPYGTADQLNQGADNPQIPADMTFVQGDTLIVKNEDKVPHQLGPLWIAPSTSSAMLLDTVSQYSYSCSFQPRKVFGIDVRPQVTGGMRFQGILAIGLPSGLMLAVYSYMLPGLKKPAELAAKPASKVVVPNHDP